MGQDEADAVWNTDVDPSKKDEELVRIVRERGETGRAAMDALVRRHQGWVRRLLAHVLGPEEADDVAQDVFVAAYEKIGTLRDPNGIRSWLRRIALRMAFNARRSRRRRDARHEHAAEIARMFEPRPPEEFARRAFIEQVLSRLPYPYREILVLRYVEELALKEIGELLDIGVPAAKMRLLRARREFLRHYEALEVDRDA